MRTLADRQREREKAEADDRDLTSRTDRRREQSSRETALKKLARRLVGLKPHQLTALALGEELRDAIDHARAIRSANAHNRQIAVVRQHLRDMGTRVAEVEQQLARITGTSSVPAGLARAAHGGPVVSDAPPSEGALASFHPSSPQAHPSSPQYHSVQYHSVQGSTGAWVDRLADEGDAALDELVTAHPALDRQQLRHLLRALVKARAGAALGDARRAQKRLQLALEAVLGARSSAAS